MDTFSPSFFQNHGTFLDLKKKAGETSSTVSPSCVSVSVVEHASVSLNIPKYPLINCSDYARALIMPNHLTCSTDF